MMMLPPALTMQKENSNSCFEYICYTTNTSPVLVRPLVARNGLNVEGGHGSEEYLILDQQIAVGVFMQT